MYVILLMKSTSEYNKNFRGSNFRSTSILKPFDVLGEIQTKRTVRDKNNSREIGESVFSSWWFGDFEFKIQQQQQ